MSKSGLVRLVVLIFFFLFMILYVIELTGYNEYSKNQRNMLTQERVEAFEKDIASGRDVSIKDYTESEKNYNNRLSSFGLSLSRGIGNLFDEGMNAFFKVLEEAAKKG